MAFSISKAIHVDWNQESYPLYQDFMVLLFFVVFFPSARLILDRFFFEKIAKRLLFGKTSVKPQMRTQRKKIDKFKECAWKSLYAVSAELLALYVTYNEPWFSNTKYFWTGPGDQVWPDQKMKLKLKLLYMYSGGFYIYAIFALLFWDTRRSDFKVSMAHHVATVALIVFSYIFRFGRVGSVILALHEASDVFLETAKMSKYSGRDRAADILFVLFTLSWFILRLIIFPFWVLRSTSYDAVLILAKEEHPAETVMAFCLLNALLFCLLVMHIYWWSLMFRMLVRQVLAKGQIGNDVRSDSEGEEEHED